MKNQLKRPEITRIHVSELTYMGHGKYIGEEYNYKGKPFTGFAVMDYHDNDYIAFEQEYVDGQPVGWRIDYHDNGKIEYECLMAGATVIVYREFSQDGMLLDEGWLESKAFYNKIAEETGMEKI